MSTFTAVTIEQDAQLPRDIRAAMQWAEANDEVHVIIVEGSGKKLCGGCDSADSAGQMHEYPCQQESFPDYAYMKRNPGEVMSVWVSSQVFWHPSPYPHRLVLNTSSCSMSYC